MTWVVTFARVSNSSGGDLPGTMKGTGHFNDEAVPHAVTDRRTTYLLPCSCGRDISDRTAAGRRNACAASAAGLVPCPPCGRSKAFARPRLSGDCLRQKTRLGKSAEISRGGPGGVLASSDSSGHSLSPVSQPVRRTSDLRRLSGSTSRACRPLETMQYFHQWILPGIEIPEQAEVQSKRSMVYLGMAAIGRAWGLSA